MAMIDQPLRQGSGSRSIEKTVGSLISYRVCITLIVENPTSR